MKKNIELISKVSFVVLAFVFCIIALLFFQQRKQDMRDFGLEEAQNSVLLNIEAINSAIASSNDIKLFSILESLSKTKNIISCFVMDKDGKIVLRNIVNQIPQDFDSDKYKTALSKKETLLQKSEGKDNFIYSVPAAENHRVFVLISTQKNIKSIRNWLTFYLVCALIFAFILTSALFFTLKKFILIPFEKTKSDFFQGKLDDKNNLSDEVSTILLRERKKSQKAIDLLKTNESSLIALISILCREQSDRVSLMIVLNSLNNIVYAGGQSHKLLKSGFGEGKNIVECVLSPELLSAISKSNDNPNVEINVQLNDMDISILSASKDKEILGTIITSKK
jgi:hypothetical protein